MVKGCEPEVVFGARPRMVVCPQCGGTGRLPDGDGQGGEGPMDCPSCNGRKHKRQPSEADMLATIGEGPYPTENPRDRDMEEAKRSMEDYFELQCKLYKLTSSERACVLSYLLHRLNERFVAIERRAK